MRTKGITFMIKTSLMSFVIFDCIGLCVACNQAGHVMRRSPLCPGRLSQLGCHGIEYLNEGRQRDYEAADEVTPMDVTRKGGVTSDVFSV